jgi:hypothetical protein
MLSSIKHCAYNKMHLLLKLKNLYSFYFVFLAKTKGAFFNFNIWLKRTNENFETGAAFHELYNFYQSKKKTLLVGW